MADVLQIQWRMTHGHFELKSKVTNVFREH